MRLSTVRGRAHKARGRWPGLALLLLVAAAPSAAAEKREVSEYQVKAAFLYNFTKFAKWPESAFETPAAPFVIGVLGQDPFGLLLDEAVAGRSSQDRPVVIRRYPRLEDLGPCHVLFVSGSERKRLPEVFAALAGKPVMSVGDMPEFLAAGGIIDLVVREERVQLGINPEPAERAGLKLSSQLLKLAKGSASRGGKGQ